MTKKHVSRKLKSSWRKHIDTTEIDEFLEQQRQDERIGAVEEQPDSSLFTEEKKTSKPKATRRELRHNKFAEEPKSFLALKNVSRVRDPIVKRNIKKQTLAPLRNTSSTSVSIRVPRKKTILPKSICEANQEDLWTGEDVVPKELQSEWIGKEQVLHTLQHVGKPMVKQPGKIVTGKETLPASSLPREGTSYNPAIDDYLELKDEAVAEQRKIRKREAHFDRVITNMFVKELPEVRRQRQLQEMSEGLIKAEKDESEVEDCDSATVPVGKRKKPKAKKSRSKRQLQYQKLREQKLVKAELKKLKDINRAAEINAELEKAEAKKALKKMSAEGPKVDIIPIDFIEPQQLTGSLRTVQPTNNLMATGLPKLRKVSIFKKSRAEVQRNIRAPRKKVKYVRSSHKNVE
ncbi:ribosome biogenesis protein NOP53 [Anopheles bellator]|uniref:ribosome biogenesis protein NOP53 n=1 Tax=Anopheles bellator TaxID=139047 RepID=UPI002647EB3B|nr:ribosome biogenesis protein NOP53 [Anopheles bellator]